MKNRLYLTIAMLLIATQFAFCYLPDYLIPGEHFEFRPHYHKISPNPINQLKSALNPRPYDVLEYDIFMDWYKLLTSTNITGENRFYSGINKIKVKVDTAVLSGLELDAASIIIDSVKYSKDNSILTFSQIQDIVKITLPTQFFKGDTLQIDVYFTQIGKENKGIYIYDKGKYVGQGPPPKRDSVYVLERIAYTMSEPQNARFWLPCNDSPHDKAFVKMAVKLPKGFNLATNGLRKNIKTINDSVFYYYESKYPMTTYLITVNASKFRFEEDKYVRISNPLDTLPIHYYVWEDDWTSDTTNGTAYNAQHAFRNVPKMMKVYSNYYGEYPFEKYGMVAVQPFDFGGMEHQTMTTINRSWLRGYSESGIAHELAHQWIGDLITCATWFDIWINEGGATWSEAIWYESLYGKDYYYDYMNQIINRYFVNEALFNIPIYGVPINSIFTYPISVLEYNKASWVYHMLRENLGDDKFFGALRFLLERYKFYSIETVDFLHTFSEYLIEPPLNLDKFFEQWIMKAGHPIFEISSKTAFGNNYYDVEVNINQIQEGSNVPSVFEMPIELLLYKDSTIKQTHTVYMDKRNQSFKFTIDFRPDSIKINTNKILAREVNNIMTLEITNENKQDKIFPNPVKTGTNFNLSIDISHNGILKIELYDLLGNKLKDLYQEMLTKGSYNIQLPTFNLPSGQYLVKYSNGKDAGIQHLLLIN